MIKATLIDSMGSDLSVVNAARVSFGKKSWWVEGHKEGHPSIVPVLAPKDEKLINYLAKHEHYSPFGHCFASFHIKAPIFVARQLVKHEYLRMNEISRRYVDSEPEFYVPDVWRGRAKDKKQGSDGVVEVGYDFPWVEYGSWGNYKQYLETCEAGYKSLLEKGVAPEMARMVLPQSMYTEWYWSGSLDAFANMCNLRLKEDTQYETRLVAQQIDNVMGELYPVSWKALVHND